MLPDLEENRENGSGPARDEPRADLGSRQTLREPVARALEPFDFLVSIVEVELTFVDELADPANRLELLLGPFLETLDRLEQIQTLIAILTVETASRTLIAIVQRSGIRERASNDERCRTHERAIDQAP